MVAAIAAVGMMYGSVWAVRQVPKVFSLFLGIELWKAKKKVDDYERTARLGFDIFRDLKNKDFTTTQFHRIRFPEGSLPERLQFLVNVDLFLTSEETFMLKKAMEAVKADEQVRFRFNKLIEISKERLSDKRFVEAVSKDGK